MARDFHNFFGVILFCAQLKLLIWVNLSAICKKKPDKMLKNLLKNWRLSYFVFSIFRWVLAQF